jgi:hypothetical protein
MKCAVSATGNPDVESGGVSGGVIIRTISPSPPYLISTTRTKGGYKKPQIIVLVDATSVANVRFCNALLRFANKIQQRSIVMKTLLEHYG